MYRFFLFFALIPAMGFGQTPEDDYLTYLRAGGRCGTGVVIEIKDEPDGKKAIILTCFHVVLEDGGKNRITVVYRCGDSFVGKLLAWDAVHDLALIEVKCPDGIVVCPIAKEVPKGGDPLRLRGLGGNSDLLAGTIRDFEFSAGVSSSGNLVLGDIVVIGGDSGGAVLRNGELVGIVMGGYETVDDGTSTNTAPSHWGLCAVGLNHITRLKSRVKPQIINP